MLCGCNPIPVKYTCVVPRITGSERIKPTKHFPNISPIDTACQTAVPEELDVEFADGSGLLHVLVQGEWLRLRAQTNSGQSLEIEGSNIRSDSIPGYTHSLRVDKTEGHLTLEARDSAGKRHSVAANKIEMVNCSCKSFDAI